MKTWLILNDVDDTIDGVSQLTGDAPPRVESGKSVVEVSASLYGSVFRDPLLVYKWDKAARKTSTIVNPDPDSRDT